MCLKNKPTEQHVWDDVMVRCQSKLEIETFPPPAPSLKSRFIADHIKSKYWSTAALKAEGPHGYDFLWKPIPTRLAVNENICFA